MCAHTVRSVIAEYDESGGDIHNMCAKSSCKRGTASPSYTYEHRRIKKEMVLSCHEFCIKAIGKGYAIHICGTTSSLRGGVRH